MSEGATGATAIASRFSPRTLARIEWLLIAVSYGMLFFERHWIGSDAGERFAALDALLDHHAIPTTRYSLVGPLFSAPLYFLGKLVLHDPKLACTYYNWVLLGVLVVLLARCLAGVLEPPTLRRFLLLLVAGSMFANHAQAYYAEVFTAACVATGVLALVLGRSVWLAWVAIVLGAANTPGVGLGVAAVSLFFTMESRRLRFLLPLLAVGAIIAFETFVRRKGETGYEGVHQNTTVMPYSGRPGFSYPMFLGLLSLTLSFGKGILYYAPGVFAPVGALLEGKAALLKTYRIWLLYLAGLMLVYAKFCGWYGGVFWGPRYVMFASVPASLALALNLGARTSPTRVTLTLAMLTLSVWVCADGVVFGQKNQEQCWADKYALEHLCWYVPEFSAWIRPFVSHAPITALGYAFLGLYTVVYLYLAAPLVSYLVTSMVPRCRPHVERLLAWRAWGF